MCQSLHNKIHSIRYLYPPQIEKQAAFHNQSK